MEFDKRWVVKYTAPLFLSVFFILPKKEIIAAGTKWKDFIMKNILARENGEAVYNSKYVPENNVGNNK